MLKFLRTIALDIAALLFLKDFLLSLLVSNYSTSVDLIHWAPRIVVDVLMNLQ